MAYYQTNIEVEEQQDLGLAIQRLIESNIKNAYTSYLAKITSIVGNKIHIKPIIKTNQDDKEVIINNALIAFPFSQEWQMQYKLKIDDIGLAIVSDKDLTAYKNSGSESIAPTKRYKNISDAIFFPVSMFNTLENDSVNFTIQNDKKNCALTFDNDEIGTLKAKLLTIQSENTTLKTELKNLANHLKDLASTLEGMASGSTGLSGGNAHTHTTSPSSVGKFNSWASKVNTWSSNLDKLFKD